MTSTELPALHEGALVRRSGHEVADQDGGAGDEHDQADIEREISRFRPVGRPAVADPVAVEHDHDGHGGEHQGYGDFHRVMGGDGVFVTFAVLLHPSLPLENQSRTDESAAVRDCVITGRYFARKPAFSIRALWVVSALASQVLNSSPVMKVVLKAPFAMKSFQSGVSRTFWKRST